ncbi:MAG: sigma-70 family RNA polymerase sigma factor [Armatimonadetes bacterium]|nr:sigma-70 family RNA polymerase sigma factor [Armatimonadota bacterium]
MTNTVIVGGKSGRWAHDLDRPLVERCRLGDTDAFDLLIARHYKAILAVVVRMADSRDDVEDIVQEVFVRAWENIAAFRGECLFTTWLHRIAINYAITAVKRLKRHRGPSLDDPDSGLMDDLRGDDAALPSAMAERHEKLRLVREAITRLPEKHRTVVMMRYFGEQSCEEIARALSCPVGTVKSRLFYAYRKLGQELQWLVE